MKKNMRNALAISGLAIAMGTSTFTLEASANNGSNSRMQRSHQERMVRTRKLKKEKITAERINIIGTISELNNNSLIIKENSKTYTVNIASDTRLLDHDWEKINISDIKVGDSIRILGTISGLTITAKTIRDISLQ